MLVRILRAGTDSTRAPAQLAQVGNERFGVALTHSGQARLFFAARLRPLRLPGRAVADFGS